MPQTRNQSNEIRSHTQKPSDTSSMQSQQVPDHTSPLSEFPHIDIQSHQIRTLCLLPGAYHDPIRCILRTEFLDVCPEYEALSYAWGDPLDCRSIDVNGSQKSVTVNLFNALRNLRYPKDQRCLWVDALCINQENDIEKSHQVQLMSKIYSCTAKAILWLGDFSDGSQTTPNYIHYKSVLAAFSLIKLMANSPEGCVNNAKNEDLINDGYEGLSLLLQLPWWHRAWTVQETVLPTEAVVVCGTAQLPFSTFVKAYHISIHHNFRNCCDKPIVPDMFWNQMHALIFIKGSLEKNVLCICYAFNLFRDRHASDLRDKIYAYLGLESDISADYSLPYEQVFKLVTRSIIEKYDILDSLLRTAEQERSSTLPSWVPDWSASIDYADYDHELGWYYLYEHYTASGETKPQIGPSCSDDILNLRGLILETISEVGDTLNDGSAIREMVLRWQGGPNDQYPQGGTYLEASLRTLMGDLNQGQGFYRRLEKNDNVEASINDQLRQYPSGNSLAAFGRKGFFTETGMMGIGHPDIQAGDFIAIFQGGNMPFILRKANIEKGNTYYQFIGQAYVHGIMDGEVLDKGLSFEWINLI